MPHNDFVRPDGQWPDETVLTPGDARAMDVAQYQALNGDAGGTWNPTTPIVLGGAGLVLTGSGAHGHSLSGGVNTARGGRVVLGHSDWPTFYGTPPTVSLTRVAPLQYRGRANFSAAGAGTSMTARGVGVLFVPVASRNLHHGATILSANVGFLAGRQHQRVPATLPIVLFVRSDYAPYVAVFAWSAFGVHTAGDIVIPTTPNGYSYAATSNGTPGGAEPVWPTTVNSQTAADGGITSWVCTGYGPGPAWASGTAYALNKIVSPKSNNGLVYQATAVAGTGTSAATEPVWPLTVGATVVDNPGGNQITWTCLGLPAPAAWVAGRTYPKGAYVKPNPANGFFYKSNHSGTAGGAPPAWLTVVESDTVDNTCSWSCQGTLPIGAGSLATPASGDAYWSTGAAQTLSVPCGGGATTIDTANYSYGFYLYDESGIGACQTVGTAPWGHGQGYGNGFLVTPVPGNGLYYVCTAAGTSASNPPVWPTAIGSSVTEVAGPTWECSGPTVASVNTFTSATLSFSGIADMHHP